MIRSVSFASVAVLFLALVPAHADVGVVLNESLPTGGEGLSSTGHSAVYFSHICPESPVKLRLCRPGEHGSILSNYTGFQETQPFNWNIAPLGVYLYGGEGLRQWPLVGTKSIKRALEDRYRARYLSAYCPPGPCADSEKADWRDMAGAGLSRGIYIFVVETTDEQDRELIEKFNALPNENRFNAVTRNCADFTRYVINTYFPHATKREFLNDFGMSSPKATARSFTKYAKQHPELKFHVLHFAQLPGTIKRSREVRDGTEQLYHSALFVVPLAIFADYVLPAAMVSYGVSGRFNPEHEWEARPNANHAEIEAQIQAAKADHNKAEVERLEAEQREERDRVLGTDQDWGAFRRDFDAMLDEAVEQGILPKRKSVDDIFEQLDKAGSPYFDARGGLWMAVPQEGGLSRVGLSPTNVLAPGSDPRLAYRVLLARTNHALKAPKRSRETLIAFKRDWGTLDAARKRCVIGPEASRTGASRSSERPQDQPAGPGRR